jgi:hypothetical protein
MKSGEIEGHQTHGDLDLGDWVLDAAGQRWFGELGSGEYLSHGPEGAVVVRPSRSRSTPVGLGVVKVGVERQAVPPGTRRRRTSSLRLPTRSSSGPMSLTSLDTLFTNTLRVDVEERSQLPSGVHGRQTTVVSVRGHQRRDHLGGAGRTSSTSTLRV